MGNAFSEMRFEDMLELLDVPLHIIDLEGNVYYVNQAWEIFMKINRADALGRHINDVLAKTSLGFFFSINNKDSENDIVHFEEKEFNSTAITTLQHAKPSSMFTYSPDHNKVLVSSVPVFLGEKLVGALTTCADITEFSDTRDRLEDAIQQNALIIEELERYRKEDAQSDIVSKSKAISKLRESISYSAATTATILITGESGVGKEVFTNEIYNLSDRKGHPFIKINCATIPENLLESELFGYEKGAFTGAVKTKRGLFELANSGTLLLDEIGEMSKSLQPKLLRALQEREIVRIGGSERIPIDVRVIAATNQNLEKMVQQGMFRQDLYYRLNVIPLHIPPLRERKEDIPLLAKHFLERFHQKHGKKKTLTQSALNLMMEYDWPGNIREFENLMERLVIIGDDDFIAAGTVEQVLFPGSNDSQAILQINGRNLKEMVADYERAVIQTALNNHGTTYRAAKALGSSQATIARKAGSYGLKW